VWKLEERFALEAKYCEPMKKKERKKKEGNGY
jgi:hypothetical protein